MLFFQNYKYLLPLLFCFLSCTYGTDKLVITNDSKNSICYQVLLKNKDENSYYHAAIGNEIKSGAQNSPIIKQTISESLNEFSKDKIIYVVFYKAKDREYVHENLTNIVEQKRFRVDRYSQRELENVNWQIHYRDKSN